MRLNDRIFKRNDSIITSPFGARRMIKTPKGLTSSFHFGTDYGTKGEKWPQYAVENGIVRWTGEDNYGAKIVWIEYPRLGKKMMHAHLDRILVKVGDKVNNNTIIGYTGSTGKETGIHLHLGLMNLRTGKWENPAWYDYREEEIKKSTGFFDENGWFGLGDTHYNIGRIALFMFKTFPAYTNRRALGNYYGPYIQASIREFQKRTGLEADGNIGQITLNELKKYGFKP